MLEAMLDWYRDGVLAKVHGIDDHAAHRAVVRSGTTISGLVKHLASAEDDWLTHRFAGNAQPEPWASAPFDEDVDWEFHSATAEPLAASVALYGAACERSRAVCVGAELDQLSRAGDPRFSLRFALVHLIEETARHLGHLDILRELADDSVGR